MKKLNIIFLATILICDIAIVSAQEQKDPDEQITVNKKFDDNGNLIQYDSTLDSRSKCNIFVKTTQKD